MVAAPAADHAANISVPRNRLSRATKKGYARTSRSQFTAETCLKVVAIPTSAPASAMKKIRRRPSGGREKKTSCDRTSGSSMNNSVLAAVPCAAGSADSKANNAAAAPAQKPFTKRRARKKSAHADAAEKRNATRCA